MRMLDERKLKLLNPGRCSTGRPPAGERELSLKRNASSGDDRIRALSVEIRLPTAIERSPFAPLINEGAERVTVPSGINHPSVHADLTT